MNWMGGTRNRLKRGNTKEQMQKSFFEKRRAEARERATNIEKEDSNRPKLAPQVMKAARQSLDIQKLQVLSTSLNEEFDHFYHTKVKRPQTSTIINDPLLSNATPNKMRKISESPYPIRSSGGKRIFTPSTREIKEFKEFSPIKENENDTQLRNSNSNNGRNNPQQKQQQQCRLLTPIERFIEDRKDTIDSTTAWTPTDYVTPPPVIVTIENDTIKNDTHAVVVAVEKEEEVIQELNRNKVTFEESFQDKEEQHETKKKQQQEQQEQPQVIVMECKNCVDDDRLRLKEVSELKLQVLDHDDRFQQLEMELNNQKKTYKELLNEIKLLRGGSFEVIERKPHHIGRVLYGFRPYMKRKIIPNVTIEEVQ